MPMSTAWQLTKQTFSEYSEDNIPRLSAALAYYAIFSIAPLFVIAIAVAGFVYGGQGAAQEELRAQMQDVVGPNLAGTISSLVQGAGTEGGGIVATMVSVIILLVGATTLFAELQSSLNTIWEVKPRSTGVWGLLRTRFLAFLMVLGIGALLLASLILSAVLSGMTALLGAGVGYQILNQVVSLAIFTLLFAMIYKWLPDVEMRWRDVWIGAALTAVLFAIGRYLIGLYLARGSVGSVFGAAGSLVALLVWIYYSAQIVFIGAEFTQVYAKRYGGGIRPTEYAERTAGVPGVQAKAEEGVPRREERGVARGYASAVALGPARAYSVPVSRTVPERVEATEQKGSSTRQRLIPLAMGLAIGRFLLPRQAKPRRQSGRTFAPGRIFEPGWRSRQEDFAHAHPRLVNGLRRVYWSLRSRVRGASPEKAHRGARG